jgi:hypothetical protein
VTVTATSVTGGSGSAFVTVYDSSTNFVTSPTSTITAEGCMATGTSFSFNVTAGQTFVIVVQGCFSNSVGETYTLSVDNGALTPATFRSFSPVVTRPGTLVRWRTASEANILGFNVFREANGIRSRVNRRVIAAKGGRTHSYLDRKAPRARRCRYWIQVVNLDGTRRWHGPAVVGPRQL